MRATSWYTLIWTCFMQLFVVDWYPWWHWVLGVILGLQDAFNLPFS